MQFTVAGYQSHPQYAGLSALFCVLCGLLVHLTAEDAEKRGESYPSRTAIIATASRTLYNFISS